MKKIINKVCENDCLTVRFIDKYKGRYRDESCPHEGQKRGNVLPREQSAQVFRGNHQPGQTNHGADDAV